MNKSVGAILLCMGVYASMNAAVNLPNTTVSYEVVYHWGLIDKVAGEGTVNYYTSGNEFVAYMNGHSIPWGGKIFTVNTSLSAIMTPVGSGNVNEMIQSIQGRYSKPEVGENASTAPYKDIYGGGTLDASPQTMEAVNVLADMLGIFYYSHILDFPSMSEGSRVTVPIIRAGQSMPLYITYMGTTEYNRNGFSTRAYEIQFQYTYEGAPDAYPVTCMIDANTRIPVFFSAHLLIGHVEMCYNP